jgi:hypothetical protein
MTQPTAKPLYKKLFSKTLIIFYFGLIVSLFIWEITDPTLPYEETIILSLQPGTIAASDNHFYYDPLGASQPMIRFTPNLRHLGSDIYPTANASIYELRWMSLTGEQQHLLLNMDYLLINDQPASTLLLYDSSFLRYWDFRAYQFSTQNLPCWPYTIEVLDGFNDNNTMELNITFALPDQPIFCIAGLRNGA